MNKEKYQEQNIERHLYLKLEEEEQPAAIKKEKPRKKQKNPVREIQDKVLQRSDKECQLLVQEGGRSSGVKMHYFDFILWACNKSKLPFSIKVDYNMFTGQKDSDSTSSYSF